MNSKSRVVFISKALREYYRDDISDDVCQVVYNDISSDFLVAKDYKEKKINQYF